ncbi:MAG: squalene/phytoene synthase family protein [Verrucomicrobiae bacterium]|nr:squalene/phytoene synthase family protein [Verrucomicrobiae bacterium]NNJ43388.1 squalene/phytoene synthase family protein [Akkermansiaceae bacterium]
MSSSQEITRKAKSNLAFALSCLPKERKRDMVTFYAFCRVIDDLADDLDIPLEKRQQGLNAWSHGINHGFDQPDELQAEVMELIDRYSISKQPFLDLISGCESDLQPQRFNTWEDLKNYTYRVASCVGVISTRIFGCTHPDSEKYAVALGHALQLTNILRDVDEDLRNGGRIYLPIDDFTRFQYSEHDLTQRIHDERFTAMMTWQADRAETLYQEALDHLQAEDAKALKAAEAMRKIYHSLLTKMRNDHFHVFTQRYSLSKAKKAAILLATLASR